MGTGIRRWKRKAEEGLDRTEYTFYYLNKQEHLF
jgi:hypothetical protein